MSKWYTVANELIVKNHMHVDEFIKNDSLDVLDTVKKDKRFTCSNDLQPVMEPSPLEALQIHSLGTTFHLPIYPIIPSLLHYMICIKSTVLRFISFPK